jgi:hypothetical protein
MKEDIFSKTQGILKRDMKVSTVTEAGGREKDLTRERAREEEEADEE